MESLAKHTVAELRTIARELGIRRYSRMRKAELINVIETVRADRDKTTSRGDQRPGYLPPSSAGGVSPSQVDEDDEPDKTERAHPHEGGEPILPLIDTGELPLEYDDVRFLEAIPRSPWTVMCVWSLSQSELEELKSRSVALRLSDTTRGGRVVRQAGVAVESERWYVHSLEPDRTYLPELGWQDERGFVTILSGAPVTLPPAGPSRVEDAVFVEIDPQQPLPAVDMRPTAGFSALVPDQSSGASELDHAQAVSSNGGDELRPRPAHNWPNEGQWQLSVGSSWGGSPSSR